MPPFDPDPEVKVRDWFLENSRRNSGDEAAERRMKRLDRLIPHAILDAPATELNCQNLFYILEAMRENFGDNVGVEAPEERDMSDYEGAETVGDLVHRYLSQHCPEDITKLVAAFGEMLSDTWDDVPSEAERRRWVTTLRLTCPPRFLREQAEVSRIAADLPSRN